MIAENIKEKLESGKPETLSVMECSWLVARLYKIIENDKYNKKYYMVKNTDTNRKKMWTLAEINFLEKCFHEGKTDRYIASELKRTIKGVERMRHKMGLKKGE